MGSSPPADRDIEFTAVISPDGQVSYEYDPADERRVRAFADRPEPARPSLVDVDALAERVVARVASLLKEADDRKPPKRASIRDWVGAEDVQRALGISRSEAYRKLRQAAGRKRGTKKLLRVTPEVWEDFCDREGLGR